MLSQLPNLNLLAIVDCQNIRGESIFLCDRLQILSLNFCRRVTNGGVIRLIRGSNSVRLVMLNGTSVTAMLCHNLNEILRNRTDRETLTIAVDRSSVIAIEEQAPLLIIQ